LLEKCILCPPGPIVVYENETPPIGNPPPPRKSDKIS
jgi:hypothetical protein